METAWPLRGGTHRGRETVEQQQWGADRKEEGLLCQQERAGSSTHLVVLCNQPLQYANVQSIIYSPHPSTKEKKMLFTSGFMVLGSFLFFFFFLPRQGV